MLYDTANDIDLEIQKEKGWTSVLPHLKKVVCVCEDEMKSSYHYSYYYAN